MAYSIMLDAGHGGAKDPGAVYEGRQEKDDNLKLVLAIGEILSDRGLDVEYTRTTDVYETPYEKAMKANNAGVDLFVVETMMSLNECRAALIAIREVTDLPVCVTLSFNEDGRTLFGTDACTAMVVLQSLGADAVGVNCSTGPEQMAELVRKYVGKVVLRGVVGT